MKMFNESPPGFGGGICVVCASLTRNVNASNFASVQTLTFSDSAYTVVDNDRLPLSDHF